MNYRTIMATTGGARIPRYSNPLVFFQATPTGIAAANNAFWMDFNGTDAEDFELPVTKTTPVWVDADAIVPGNGSLVLPYATFEEAFLRLAPGGRVIQKGLDADSYAGGRVWFQHGSVELEAGSAPAKVGT